MLTRIMAWLRPRRILLPLARFGILTGSDTKFLFRVIADGIPAAERLDRKIDLVVETMQRMVEEAGLSDERLDAYDRAWSAIGVIDHPNLIERIEALEERAGAQDDAWAAWRESRGGKS